jgi:hypothetical protein
VRVLPAAVVVDGASLEVADVDVVQEWFDLERHLAPLQCHLRGLPRAPEAGADAEVERDSRQLHRQ